jgi:hypothetical protein
MPSKPPPPLREAKRLHLVLEKAKPPAFARRAPPSTTITTHSHFSRPARAHSPLISAAASPRSSSRRSTPPRLGRQGIASVENPCQPLTNPAVCSCKQLTATTDSHLTHQHQHRTSSTIPSTTTTATATTTTLHDDAMLPALRRRLLQPSLAATRAYSSSSSSKPSSPADGSRSSRPAPPAVLAGSSSTLRATVKPGSGIPFVPSTDHLHPSGIASPPPSSHSLREDDCLLTQIRRRPLNIFRPSSPHQYRFALPLRRCYFPAARGPAQCRAARRHKQPLGLWRAVPATARAGCGRGGRQRQSVRAHLGQETEEAENEET